MNSVRSRRDCWSRQRSRRGRPPATSRAVLRCRRSGCPERTCTPCSSRHRPDRRSLPHPPADRCCLPCRPPPMSSCGGRHCDWPIGCSSTRTISRRPTWRTRWRVGVGTDRCARVCLRRACRSWPTVCGSSPATRFPIPPRSGRTTADRCGCSPVRARSGRRWARSYWPPSPRSPHASPNSSR